MGRDRSLSFILANINVHRVKFNWMGFLISVCLGLLAHCQCPTFILSSAWRCGGVGNLEMLEGCPRDPEIKHRQSLVLLGVVHVWAAHQHPLIQRDVVSSLQE